MLLAAASVVGAIASTAFLLIIARVAQGLGGAAILACGLGLIGQAYPGKALARATGIWAAALGAGVAVGPILAAGLNGLGGWPAAYWFSAAASAVLAVAGRIFLPESNAAHPRRIDFAGTLLLGFAMAALLAGLTQSWPHSSRSSAALPAQCLISRYSGGLTSRALSLLRLPQAQPDGLG